MLQVLLTKNEDQNDASSTQNEPLSKSIVTLNVPIESSDYLGENMTKTKPLPHWAVLLTLTLFSLQYFSTTPPGAKGLDTPEDQFSGVRAYNILKSLLKENMPHPVGSKLNRAIKERLKSELDKLDINYEEQKTWACSSRFVSCAEVENLIAIIPGKTDSPYLALMAHYDSVPMSSGAGDDGAGVVAILETARALKLEAPFSHPIVLILTDGEESGLIGAEAFFGQHPLSKEIGVVLNVEGSGSAGSSMVLRTSVNNELLIKSYSSQNSSPYGFSFVKEIFKRMPNDTDFSVVKRAKIPGIDFAFAGERNHYHTPNDNLENIDLRTIQHHGENLLPLSRKLASVDWSDMGDPYVYGGEIYGFWTQWKSSNSLFLLIFSAILLAAATLRAKIEAKKVMLGIALSPLTILVTVLSGAAGFYLLFLMSGKIVSWPGVDWPYRLLLISSTSLGALIGTALSRRFVGQSEMIFASWLSWLILSMAALVFLPDAANTLILPLAFSSLFLLSSTFMKEDSRPTFLLSTLVITLPFTLGLIFPLEQSQGYKLVWALLPFIGLYALTIGPFLYSLNIKLSSSYISAAVIVALMAGSYMDLYTKERPQHVNIRYYEDLDSGEAYFQLLGNNDALFAEPLQEPLLSYVNTKEAQSIVPFNKDYLSTKWATTGRSGWQGPSAEKKVALDQPKTVTLSLRSNRSAGNLVLLLPKDSGLESFLLGSLDIKPILSSRGLYKDYYVIYLNGVYDETVELELHFGSDKGKVKAYLIDISTGLPSHLDRLYKERSGVLSPVHRGDQAMLIRTIEI